MILNLPDGTKREVDDAKLADFLAQHGKIPEPTAADYYAKALMVSTKAEYTDRCGPNQFADLHVAEVNKFMAARLAALIKSP